MSRTTPVAPPHQPVAAAPRVVTQEDADKAREAIAELERTEQLVTSVLVVLGVGGLIFTAVNVTLFAIQHHVSKWIAWMLDPLVSVSLLAALFVDGKLSAHGYRPSGWPFALRWFAGLATWLMNCWGSLYPDAQFTGWPDDPDPAGLLLHSVIPFLVIFLAEAGAGYRKFSMRKKTEHLETLAAWKDQEETRRRTEAEAQKRREENARATAEAERKRAADLEAERQHAAIEAAKARDLAEAKAREIQAESEAEARRAEQARLDAEARHRTEAEARNQQARIDRENAAHAAELERQRIQAEAQAEAEKLRAQAAAKADADAREARKRAAEARRTSAAIPTALPHERTAIPTAETTALLNGGTAKPTALPAAEATAKPRKPTALPTAQTTEADDVRGAEAKRKQIEDANFEAAVLIFTDQEPTRKEFAARYGRSETWGRERYADAVRLMDEDTDYAARVLGEAERRKTAS